tara:strand:- start:921 stop:1763 length:843 start_codon:yes stop_codon:yes gene_type:complete
MHHGKKNTKNQMINIENKLLKLNLPFEIISKIRDGETSKTYLGKFKNKKAIFKLFNIESARLKNNQYLKLNMHKSMSINNLCPKVLFISDEYDLLIYEFFKTEEGLKVTNIINILGKKLKQVHLQKIPKDLITFEDQLNNYEEILSGHSKLKKVKEGIELYKDLIHDETDLVFSHNDLNTLNVLLNKNSVSFIDWEYSSINSKYYDLSKIINSFKLDNIEINRLFLHYGLETTSYTIKKIKYWKLMDTYLALMWSMAINKIYKNYFNDEWIDFLEGQIKQ